MILAGRYDLVRSLGRGGMGQVWEARDTVLDRRVAVKTVHIGPGSDPTLAARFRREAVATAALTHPNIVTVHDAGLVPDDDGAGTTAFLVMEFLPGSDLAATLRERGALPLPEALHVGERVADALAAAHAIGVVHRDVKPANVLLDGARVTVVDFGIAALARSAETALTAPGSTLGTAEYMAPEQASGAPVSPAADVYSLGCLLYALLTGTPPFTAEHPVAVLRGHVDDAAPSLSERLPAAPADLVRLVDTMLAKDPAARPRAGEVRDALALLGGAGSPSVSPAGAAADADRPTTALPAAGGTRALPSVGAAAVGGLGGAGIASGAPSVEPAPPATERFEAGAAPSSSSAAHPEGPAGDGVASDRGDDGTSWRALPLLVAGIAAVALIAVGLGTLFRPDPVPPGPPRVESSTIVGPTSTPTPTPTPTPSPTVAAPAQAPEDLDAAMVALLGAIEAIDTETRESLAARTDLLGRWEDLDQAIDDGRDRQVQTRLRDLSRRAEALAREESITPAEAAALTAAIEAVDGAVAAGSGGDSGDD